MSESVLRLWRTVRHLRPVQIYGRAIHRWQRPHVSRGAAPPRRSLRLADWRAPIALAPSMTGPDAFRFLGEEHALSPGDWDSAELPKLWRYNLHYFADLVARDASTRLGWHRALLSRWIRENPFPLGSGWESYPTSLRIINWVKWALAGNELSPECVDSLALQARWLSRRLERHLLGNHLFVNAKALLFAGAFFEGREADQWTKLGADVLRQELPEQILADGGQFELSPMYHALALEDLLDLCNLARIVPAGSGEELHAVAMACGERVDAMLAWLRTMTHPDGEIAFFNDAAQGIAPDYDALADYARRLGLGAVTPVRSSLEWLSESGYARLACGSAVAIVDVAAIGPGYLPGHAHADTLSFELSLFGARVLVNSGTSRYGTDAERQRQRGTPAHNTVTVDGADSSEVWAGFRVGRRAHTFGVRATVDESVISVEGSHDGYRFLRGRPVHRRQWRLEQGVLAVTDEILGGSHVAEARLHLHPGVTATMSNAAANEVILGLSGGRAAIVRVDGGALRVEPSVWHPRFGAEEPSHCLVMRFTGPSLRTVLTWNEDR